MEAGFFVSPETDGERRQRKVNNGERQPIDVLMMSDSAKRIRASSLRREKHATTADRQERNGVPPTWCAHAERKRAPSRFETILHIKGFGGGVPQNTETAAVKPRAGVE